ncbi:MAG: twin-arginine translocase subunit TatC [bacterium]
MSTESAPPKNEKEMTFLEHLEELRWRLVRSIIAIVVGSVIAFIFKTEILDFLIYPFSEAAKLASEDVSNGFVSDTKLIYLAPTEAFMVYIKLALFAGLFISSPYIFYQLWKFIAPGLMENEKKYVPYFVFFSTFFFLAGAFFCYFVVIKIGLHFLLSFQTENLEANFAIKEYLKFVTLMILTFGIVFEMPILSYFLTRVGLLTPKFMREKRRFGIIAIFALAAIMTPPDPFSQVALALPLVVLYEFSIWVSKVALPKETT